MGTNLGKYQFLLLNYPETVEASKIQQKNSFQEILFRCKRGLLK